MVKYIFFDLSESLVNEYQKQLQDFSNTEFIKIKVQDLVKDHDIDIITSPANSYGYMCGGIDYIYSQMFKNVEKLVQDSITNSGKAYLPVGDALLVSLGRSKPSSIICAPTMKTPSNISRTPENIYYCMLAILEITKGMDKTVAIPGLGTGCGGLSVEESAFQIKKAFRDFYK